MHACVVYRMFEFVSPNCVFWLGRTYLLLYLRAYGIQPLYCRNCLIMAVYYTI